jgi:hypothetical protein
MSNVRIDETAMSCAEDDEVTAMKRVILQSGRYSVSVILLF